MLHIVPVTQERNVSGPCPRLPVDPVPGDWLLVSSGGEHRVADPAALQARAEIWADIYPENPVYAFTSGIENVRRLAGAVRAPVQGIFYDYEPNYPNEPEFTFDPEGTARNLSAARGACRAAGLRSVAYLTGQALLHPAHRWNYASFAPYADELCVQTQACVRHGVWAEALDRLSEQFGEARPMVQITIAPGLPNAVDLPTARAVRSELVARGFRRLVVWWVPSGGRELTGLLGPTGGS